MSWVAAAIVGGSLAGAAISSRGASRAADAQSAASDAAIAEQRRQFDLIRQDTLPYRNIGTQALNTLGGIYGYNSQTAPSQPPAQNPAAGPTMGVGTGGFGGGPVGTAIRSVLPKRGARGSIGLQNGREDIYGDPSAAPTMYWGGDNMGQGPIDAGARAFAAKRSMGGIESPGSFMQGDIPGGKFPGPPVTSPAPSFTAGLNVPDYSHFFASPDYQFRRDEGLRDIEGSFAARGGAASGNALRALTEYSSNLASGEFGNYFNRQASLAGTGQTAVGQSASAGTQAGANIGNALLNAGNARASGLQGRYDAYGNALGGIGQGLGWWLAGRT